MLSAKQVYLFSTENSTLPEDDPNITSISRDLKLFNDQCLGGGAYSSVFKGELNGKPCALKILSLQYSLQQEIQAHLLTSAIAKKDTTVRFRQKFEKLKSFDQSNIVKYLTAKTHPKSGHFVLVLELMDCSLREYFSVTPQRDIGLPVQKHFCSNIASALEYIHKRRIAHQDLCGDNILLDCSQEIPVAKVCDFGMPELISTDSTTSSIIPAFAHRGYLPPEALLTDSSQFDLSFDIYQFGVLMVQIVHCLATIKSPQERSKEFQKLDSAHPFRLIIEQCLLEDPTSRPSAGEIQKQLTSVICLVSR